MSRAIDVIEPLEPGHLRIYCCGPTVYDFAHIGNLRKYVCDDILVRTLRHAGLNVTHVMNVTDVDDKIINAAPGGLEAIREYTAPYTKAFFEDLATLRIQDPDVVCAATEHVDQMVDMVQKLIDRGHAYQSDGSYYFRIASFPEYGKLARIDTAGMRAGARVEVDEYSKDDVRDFALWKAHKEGEVAWDTSLGRGRPGWHIECSAMSMHYLGESFDMHTGGVDNAFPHHENEIAQAEGATGKPFVKYWIHHEHLLMDSQKMAKSLGNTFTLRDLLDRGLDPVGLRYLLASAHNRTQLNFTNEAVEQATHTVKGLHDFMRRLADAKVEEGEASDLAEEAEEARKAFFEAMYNDLQTPQALAAMFDLVKAANIALQHKTCTSGDVEAVRDAMLEFDQILNVLDPGEEEILDDEIERMIREREEARERRDWQKADELRDALEEQGVLLEDTADGTRWKRA
jgi:cysteinyl-tRNA synthetase